MYKLVQSDILLKTIIAQFRKKITILLKQNLPSV